MKCKIGIPVSLLLLTLLPSATIALPQDVPDKSSKGDTSKTEDKKNNSSVSIQIKISVDDKPSLPPGSKIQWNGEDNACEQTKGEQPIGPGDVTSMEVRACKINILIFITGFATKKVTLDLAKNREKFKDTILITVKHQGEPEVAWKPSP
jgi:hypothetical protein